MKTGLVLEGGAIRTIFSSGACDALLTRDIMFDYVVGVSAGIAYGVSYLSRQSGRNLTILQRYVNDKRYMGGRNLLRPDNRSYFGLEFAYEIIPNELVPFDYEAFAAFPGEAEAVVTNLNTGQAEYLPVPKRDDHWLVLQATCALPFLFPIYHLNGQPYLDGGIADGIPYQHAFDKGCDRVVVFLTRERSYVRRPKKLSYLFDVFYHQYPQLKEAMLSRAEGYNACRERLFALEKEGKVLIVEPEDTRGFALTERDVDKINALYQDGYNKTLARLDEISRFMAGE